MVQISRRKLLGISSLVLAGLALPPEVPFSQTQAQNWGLPFDGEAGPDNWFVRQWYGNTRWAYRQRRALYGQGQGLHFGVDFFAPCGSPVLAIGDGTVIAIDGPYGAAPHNLLIRHPSGYVSLYGHLQVPSPLKIGQAVRRGQVVATSGVPSGADCDTHPHLHLEIRNGALSGTFNPVNLIPVNWDALTLGLPNQEGLDFEIDLDNPGRWQTIYDQPPVRFGGALFNDYTRPWPG